jgi:uncharacterized protein (DUF1330 family)
LEINTDLYVLEGISAMSTTTPPAYFILQSKAKSFEAVMERYVSPVSPILEKYEGQVIVFSAAPQVLEGNWDGNWAVIVQFPSMERAQAFYNSAEYHPLHDLRINELTEDSRALLVEGMDTTAMSTAGTPAYFMVQVKAPSLDELTQRYAVFVFPILAQYEGQMIAGSATPQVLEGDWDGNWAAILRFPSMERAQAWYHSTEYQPYRDLRINELTVDGRIVLAEGMDEGDSAH